MAEHRAPRTWALPSLFTSGAACSVSALVMFHGIDASMWWGLGGWVLAVLGVFLMLAGTRDCPPAGSAAADGRLDRPAGGRLTP